MSRPRTKPSDWKFQCNVNYMGITRNDKLFIDRFNKVLCFFEFMLSDSVPSIMFILHFLYHQFCRIRNCNFPFWVLTEKVLTNLKCILLFLIDFFRYQLFYDYSITLSIKHKCFLPNFICFLQNFIAILPGQELREERPWKFS